jgi:uncharacterized protein
MRIGIVSDTHSNYQTVEAVVKVLRKENVSCVLHCGDIEDAETVSLFEGLRTHFVYGNCDVNRQALRDAIESSGGTIQEPFGDVDLAGRKLAWIHGDDKRLLRDLETSGAFDYVFYGHTHHAEEHWSGSTRVINPGALYRAQPRTFIVLDLDNGEVERIAV